jgi:hypothetical protein
VINSRDDEDSHPRSASTIFGGSAARAWGKGVDSISIVSPGVLSDNYITPTHCSAWIVT